MRSFIEFDYSDDSRFIAIIHKSGKTHVIRNPENVKKLKDICNKYGYTINNTGVVEHRVFSILREFEEYLKKKKRRRAILKRFKLYDKPKKNMKIVRRNPVLGRTVLMGTLIMSLASLPSEVHSIHRLEIPIEGIEEVADNDLSFLEDNNNNKEAEDLFEDEFHFNYPDRSSDDNMDNTRRYEDIFDKYASMYGLDKNLLMAIASQESAGEHYDNLYNGPACGIMQIEVSANLGETVSAYNFLTGEVDTKVITNEDLEDLDSNIQVGAMILRTNLENCNYNIPLALQTYNFGPGNMEYVLDIASNIENVKIAELMSNPTNTDWLDYRNSVSAGDSSYIEHVLSYLDNDTTLTVYKRDGEEVNLKIVNDYNLEKTR